MNTIEHHISKVLSEEPYQTPKWDKSNREWVKVEFMVDCYGRKSDITDIYPRGEWEKIKSKGFYLG